MPYFLTSNYNLNSLGGTWRKISVRIELQYVRVCFCVRALKLVPDCCLFHLSALKKVKCPWFSQQRLLLT